jgi:hypothetical protein
LRSPDIAHLSRLQHFGERIFAQTIVSVAATFGVRLAWTASQLIIRPYADDITLRTVLDRRLLPRSRPVAPRDVELGLPAAVRPLPEIASAHQCRPADVARADPWLSSPAYVNVLSIFAMCNTHDLTWGTKADNEAPVEDLGSVKGSGKEVEIMLPTVRPIQRVDFLQGLHRLTP